MTCVVRVLFVCMGNICRSPTAEGVFRAILADSDLADRVEVDSAGTIGYHRGNPPDPRSQAAAIERGYDLSGLRARPVEDSDFHTFDLILAMDRANLEELRSRCPRPRRDRLRMFLEFGSSHEREVPDPYYGGEDGFGHVLDLVEDAARGLMRYLQSER